MQSYIILYQRFMALPSGYIKRKEFPTILFNNFIKIFIYQDSIFDLNFLLRFFLISLLFFSKKKKLRSKGERQV